jgi:hypothetical protein
MLEPRTGVMILVEASWEDQHGAWQTVPACMEDKSPGGACIRLKTRIGVGSRLKVQGRWQQFSGVTRYCRPDGHDFVVGIQRDTAKGPAVDPTAVKEKARPKGGRKGDALALAAGLGAIPVAEIPSPPKLEIMPRETPVARKEAVEREVVEREVENVAVVPVAVRADTAGRALPQESNAPLRIELPSELRAEIRNEAGTELRTELGTKPPPRGEEAVKERKSRFMGRKWLDMAPWRDKPEIPSAGDDASGGRKSSSKNEKENFMREVNPSIKASPADLAGEDVAGFQVELTPTEDIYRAAGIMMPCKGYSIKKVVEMLNSEHIRGLAKDMKRVAVLMALDAAGVPIEEVLQDAKARQQALDAHEAEQKKRAEAEWARKADENTQIEAELERLKAHHMARINRNIDAVAREKATFNSWVTMKQQESQSMAEAAELCLKAPAPSAPPAEVAPAPVKALAKTV